MKTIQIFFFAGLNVSDWWLRNKKRWEKLYVLRHKERLSTSRTSSFLCKDMNNIMVYVFACLLRPVTKNQKILIVL